MIKRKHAGVISVLLSVILMLTMIHRYWIPVMADGEDPIERDGITYEYDDGSHKYEVYINPVDENADLVSGSITVPGECVLHIFDMEPVADSITVESDGMLDIRAFDETETKTLTGDINLAGGAELCIFGNGRLNGTVTASQDSVMTLESYDNKPESVTLYEADGLNELTEFTEETRFVYIYFDEEDTYKWVVFVDPNEDPDVAPFVIYVELGNYDGEYSVQTFSDPACTTEISHVVIEETAEYDFYSKRIRINEDGWDPFGDPDQSIDPDPVTIKVTISDTDKVILDAGIGWDGDPPTYVTSIMEQAVSADGKTLIYSFDAPADLDNNPHDIHIAVGYAGSGDGAIVDTVNDYIYAYDTDTVDRLAAELYARFIEVAMFEDFGITSPDDLATKIQTTGDPYTINVTNADGSVDTRNVQDYEVSWGVDEQDGTPVTSVIPVYELIDTNEFLICTDFDESTGHGTTFYSRIALTDEIRFYADAEGNQLECVIYSPITDYSHVMAGGNGSEMFITNTNGLCSFQIATRYPDGARFADWGSNCRILKSTETYVAVVGEGETKDYGGLGVNGHTEDNIWKTGDGAEVRAYIGYSTLYLEPLGDAVTGVNVKDISSVSLDEPKLADGVTIGGVVDGKVRIDFASNYYDRVPVTITYTNGFRESIVILRIGLVIQYTYLDDSGNSAIRYDCKPGAECSFTYDYQSGEQALVYATYYHPSNDNTANAGSPVLLNLKFADGTSRIIEATNPTHNFNGYSAADANAVATTSFIIGFARTKYQDEYGYWYGNIISQVYTEAPFHATVLNSGYDDPDTYGGTQSGSGEGVYWDGRMDWYE